MSRSMDVSQLKADLTAALAQDDVHQRTAAMGEVMKGVLKIMGEMAREQDAAERERRFPTGMRSAFDDPRF